uniref:Uncharacterized protein n=1 Tax=Anguilla anguilla TaxID=7936 RepID=A0A0E9SJM0_ANGAN
MNIWNTKQKETMPGQ